jgi:hypothetical protein
METKDVVYGFQEVKLIFFLRSRKIPMGDIKKLLKDIERIRTDYFERRENARNSKKHAATDPEGKS